MAQDRQPARLFAPRGERHHAVGGGRQPARALSRRAEASVRRSQEVPPIPLQALQTQLQRIYEVELPLDVGDFWISDARMAAELGAIAAEAGSDEQLLVREHGEHLDVSLYIDAAVIGRLEEDDPTVRLHAGNLGDFCTAIEGVSHFIYLTWNAGYARPVSLLELELQAEVDKYVAAAFLFGRQRDGRIPGGLARWLFADPKFAAHLSALCAKRYWAANHYAAKFCSLLQQRYFRRRGHAGLVNELRRFYRFTQQQKIEHIQSAS